ncbi:MAG: hypothetical protein ACRD3W_15515 [Terriglobales bacterium]
MRHSEIHILRTVLADPDAQEKEWIEAARRMELLDTRKSPLWHQAAWRWPMLTTVLVCCVASFAMCVYVKLGYDWGYRLVQTYFGQPNHQAMNQGMVALLTLAHVVFPLNLGLAFACFKRYFGTPKYWRRVLLSCMAGETLFWYWALSMGSSEGPFLISWCLFGFAVAYFSFTIGYSVLQRFFTHWNVQDGGFINIRATFPLCTLYLVPSFILGVFAFLNVGDLDRTPLGLEMCFFALPLMVLGFRAARHSQSIRMSFKAACMVLSPFMVANVLTLIGTTICCLLDLVHLGPDLGWRAAYSALLINGLTLGATILGCTLGNLSDTLLRMKSSTHQGPVHSA